MLGPSLSPIIGGLISQYTDWHWIFWFLLIFGGVFKEEHATEYEQKPKDPVPIGVLTDKAANDW
jgi:MFS family permease